LLLPWVNTPRQLARFHRESEAMRKIDHPSVAPLLRTGSDNDTPYLVTKFIDGVTLQQKIDEQPEISIRRRVRWLLQVCKAIGAAHKYLVLHRDLKPSNIIIGPDDRAIVTDFGTAKFLDQTSSKFDFTATGELLGTPKYMAPEQLQSGGNLVLATDVYGLGGVMYFLLSGTGPFDGESFLEIADSVRNSSPEPLGVVNPKVDKDLETICNKCLRKESSRRYQSVPELTQELESWLAGRPVQARKLSRMEKTAYWVRRNPTTALLSGLLIVSLVAGLSATSYLWMRAESNYQMINETQTRLVAKNKDLVEILATLAKVERAAGVKNPDLQFRRSVVESIAKGYQQLDNPDPEIRKTEALAWLQLGRIIGQMEDRQASMHAIEKARKIFTELADQNPDDVVYLFDVFHCFNSQMLYEPALEVMEQVFVRAPEVPHYMDAYSHANLMIAQKHFYDGRYEEVVPYLDLAENVIVTLNASYKGKREPLNRKKQGEVWGLKARMHFVMGQQKKGQLCLRKAIEEFEYCKKKLPNEAEIASQEFHHVRLYAAVLAINGEYQESLKHFKILDGLTKKMQEKFSWFPGSLQFRYLGLRDHLYVAVELGDQKEIQRVQGELDLVAKKWRASDQVSPYSNSCMIDFAVDFHCNQHPSFQLARELAGSRTGEVQWIGGFWEAVSRKDYEVARTFQEGMNPYVMKKHFLFLFDILDHLADGKDVDLTKYKPWTKRMRLEIVCRRRWLTDAFFDCHVHKPLRKLGYTVLGRE